jgi:hypothetical protein
MTFCKEISWFSGYSLFNKVFPDFNNLPEFYESFKNPIFDSWILIEILTDGKI